MRPSTYDLSRELTKEMQFRRVVTLTEAAQILGCSIRTIQRRVDEGRFPPPIRKKSSGRIHGWFLDELIKYRNTRYFL